MKFITFYFYLFDKLFLLILFLIVNRDEICAIKFPISKEPYEFDISPEKEFNANMNFTYLINDTYLNHSSYKNCKNDSEFLQNFNLFIESLIPREEDDYDNYVSSNYTKINKIKNKK